MSLTDTAARNAKPRGKPYKLSEDMVCIVEGRLFAMLEGESHSRDTGI